DENGTRTSGAFVLDTTYLKNEGPSSGAAMILSPDATVIAAWTSPAPLTGPSRPGVVVERFANAAVTDPRDAALVETRIRGGVGYDVPLLTLRRAGRLVLGTRICGAPTCRATLLGYRLNRVARHQRRA